MSDLLIRSFPKINYNVPESIIGLAEEASVSLWS